MDRGQRLADFIQSIPQINLEETIDFGYIHMGAIITDAILQAGVNYKTVVAPKVQHILDTYPEAATTAGFLSVLDTVGAQRVLGWKDPEKINQIYDLTRFFLEWGLASHDDVREWLLEPENVEKIRSVRGVGPKTVIEGPQHLIQEVVRI